MEISQDQTLGEGQENDLKGQFRFDDYTLVLCHVASLSAWDRVEESGERTESFTKIIQSLKQVHTNFFSKFDFSCK